MGNYVKDVAEPVGPTGWRFIIDGVACQGYGEPSALSVLEEAGFSLPEATAYLTALQDEVRKCQTCFNWIAPSCRHAAYARLAEPENGRPKCQGYVWRMKL